MKIIFHQWIFLHRLLCPSDVTAWVLGSSKELLFPGWAQPLCGHLTVTVPGSLSHVTLLITKNSRPEADSTAAGNSLCGLSGSHFLVPFSDSQHWDWVAVPSPGRTLPLRAKQWILKAAVPCLHWLWAGWGTCRRSLWDEGESLVASYAGWFSGLQKLDFYFFIFILTFFAKLLALREKTHFKGLFET